MQILLTLKSYESKNGGGEYQHPPFSSCFTTVSLFVSFLVVSEIVGNHVLSSNQSWHPLLENEIYRKILVRHLFVDALSCGVCAVLGWAGRHVSLFPAMKGNIPKAGYEQRLFTYSPTAFRLALFFFSYQVKNLFDSIHWNDGPEFIFHHIFSMATAWGAMVPGCGHMYALFFFGMSEISTAVLCILANFDDEHGVPGLGDAFPVTKVMCGAVFVVAFIVCRCILWPIMSFYFCRDILEALKGSDPRAAYRKGWMRFFLVSLSGLSVLQVAWLGQIFVLGKEELAKVGLI